MAEDMGKVCWCYAQEVAERADFLSLCPGNLAQVHEIMYVAARRNEFVILGVVPKRIHEFYKSEVNLSFEIVRAFTNRLFLAGLQKHVHHLRKSISFVRFLDFAVFIIPFPYPCQLAASF